MKKKPLLSTVSLSLAGLLFLGNIQDATGQATKDINSDGLPDYKQSEKTVNKAYRTNDGKVSFAVIDNKVYMKPETEAGFFQLGDPDVDPNGDWTDFNLPNNAKLSIPNNEQRAVLNSNKYKGEDLYVSTDMQNAPVYDKITDEVPEPNKHELIVTFNAYGIELLAYKGNVPGVGATTKNGHNSYQMLDKIVNYKPHMRAIEIIRNNNKIETHFELDDNSTEITSDNKTIIKANRLRETYKIK